MEDIWSLHQSSREERGWTFFQTGLTSEWGDLPLGKAGWGGGYGLGREYGMGDWKRMRKLS